MKKPDKMTPEETVRFLAVEVMGYGATGYEYLFNKQGEMDAFKWNPVTDANDRDMLVEAMVERGLRISLVPTDDGWMSTVNNIEGKFPIITADTPGDAVCLASVKAVLSMKEKDA